MNSNPVPSSESLSQAEKAKRIQSAIPPNGLFADKTWRISPDPIQLEESLYTRIVELGPRIYQFYKATNLLYRQSVEGKQPSWIHQYLDAGKSAEVIELAREKAWKNDLPCVLRPDLLITEEGFAVTELDSVPGGIGVTAWLERAYGSISDFGSRISDLKTRMIDSFITALHSTIRNPQSAIRIAVVVSEEAKDYRPEMTWLADKSPNLSCCTPEELEYRTDGVFLKGERIDVIYRFFELFDLKNIANIDKLIHAAQQGQVSITPPLKPQLEEKLWFALFWFPQLSEFWRRELGDRYFRDLKEVIPYTWLLNPEPLPPHAVIPHLDIQDWTQLKNFSQKQRDLILKISGFSELAWGSRGVHVGSDMPSEEWKKKIDEVLSQFGTHPYILQKFAKTTLLEHDWYDFERDQLVKMKGRLRLCPYYFIQEDKPSLGGILATLCPADKKLIHGMKDSILTLATNP